MNPRHLTVLLLLFSPLYGRSQGIIKTVDSNRYQYNTQAPESRRVQQEPKPPEGERESDEYEDESDSTLELIVAAIAIIALGTSLYQNWLAKDASKREIRAYVGIETDVESPPPSGCIARLRIKNFGQTPAYGVKASKNVLITKGKAREALIDGRVFTPLNIF